MAGDVTSDIDKLTVHTLALLAPRGTTRAAIRRQLMAGACKRARRDPHVRELVGLMLASQQARAREQARTNVVPMRRRAAP